MTKKKYTLEGLDCAGCAAKVEAAVNKADVVESASVDFMHKRLTVQWKDGANGGEEVLQPIVDRVTSGVQVKELTHEAHEHSHEHHHHDGEECGHDHEHSHEHHHHDGEECGCGHDHEHSHEHHHHDGEECGCGHDHAHSHEHHHHDGEECGCGCDHAHSHEHSHEHSHAGHSHEHGGEENERVLLVTTLLALLAAGVGVAGMLLTFPAHGIVSAVGFCVAIVLAGYGVMLGGVKSILKLRLDESALMAIAMIAAALLGEFAEGAMVAILYRIGEWLEDKAVDNSRESIEALAEIRPDTANLLTDGGHVETVHAEEVGVDDTIVIRPHERVPLDCVVLEGASAVDSSALTGESVPMTAEAGTQLLSGMMNGDGALTARVTHSYEDSAAARIISLVTESTENKGSAEKFVTRFAVVYTPVVVGMAVLIAVIPPLLGMGSFPVFIKRALTFLVASCPCAIVISVPLAFFSAIGGASKIGVLVKGGNFAEALAKARAIAFDKTGTITEGRPTVHEVIGAEGFTSEEVARMAAAAEVNSVHPYAQAIRNYVGDTAVGEGYSHYQEISGHGVSCEDGKGRTVLCGGAKLLRQNGIAVPDGGRKAQAYVACDGRLAGSLFISDGAAQGAKETIGALKKLGVADVVMLTGDGHEAARQVAEQVGIADVRAELLPEDKVSAVQALRQSGAVTAFVGDGINDAPVLAAADVGIAMGLGSVAAIEAADVVLSSNKLTTLPRAISHFRRAMNVIKTNIAFSLAVKAAVLLAAAFGYTPMWAAVFADVGVCLLCVANASRLIKPDNK